MKYLVSGYIWVVGLLSFFTFALIGIVATFIMPRRYSDVLIRGMMRLIFILVFVRVSTEGSEKIDRKRGYLYMPNHISFIDAPLACAYFPTAVRGIEAEHHFKWPIYGWLAYRYGNLPINRKSVPLSIKSFRQAAYAVKQGISMVIFPEGHRTRDGQLQSFKKLPFLIAQEENLDIVPVGMSGVYKLNPKGSLIFRPTVIKIKIGEVIPASTVQSMDIETLMQYTRTKVAALIEYP